jgi:uncharacterized protein (UPF0548 family)
MWFLHSPTKSAWEILEANQSALPVSYIQELAAGTTRSWERKVRPKVSGFDVDQNAFILGHGEAVFHAAVAGLRAWGMAPTWVKMQGSQEPDSIVRLEFRLLGLHWWSLGRVVYTLNDSPTDKYKQRIGFAYGTLPAHVECGEERFCITWQHDDTVVYEIMAFSRPRYWLAKLGKPLARSWQRRFVRDSQQALNRYIQSTLNVPN